VAADGRILLDHEDLVAGVGQVERRLHPGDATAHHQDGSDDMLGKRAINLDRQLDLLSALRRQAASE
jgi:hypothetical protein